MPENLHFNHLIIGLGGTGGNIIRSFRKTVYQAFKSDLAPKVNLRYLYVDSSAELMGQDDPSWTTLGHSVQLEQRNQLLINRIDLSDVLNNVNQYPSLRPWLGSRADWSNILNSKDASRVGAGQKRRLGRFLFATSAGNFRNKVTELVREMQHDRGQSFTPTIATTFHVCCGLAGGTGSGSVVDAIAQIRSAFPGHDYRIIVYAQLPEEKPVQGRAGPNYHANGYAALVELNALSIGCWMPHDVLSPKGQRLKLDDAFNCCYLFNDTNEANVAVSLGDLPDIVASFLFQKIVQGPNMEWQDANVGNTIIRQETYELNAQGKEMETTPGGAPRRSRSFFSFGVKQIAYPEVEISEYLSYSFALQAARQLLFNKWIEGEGYKDEPVNQSFHEFVRDPKQVEAWRLNEEHLTLSTGILQSEITNKNWKPIGEFWKALIPNYVLHVLDQYKDAIVKMLPELTNLCETAFNEQYRGSGVRHFYEIKRKEMSDHSRELRLRIEADLFSDWRTGTRSMHDNDRLVTALIDSLDEQLRTIDAKIAKTSEKSDLYTKNETKIGENRKQWSKLGILSTAFGKHKNILNAQAEALIRRYTLKTELEGHRFARELVQLLLQELNILSADIGRCKAILNKAAGDFQTAMENRLNDRGNKDLGRQMVRQYDPALARDFIRDLSRDAVQQRKQTGEVREKLVLLMGEKKSFAVFADKITQSVFENTVLCSCEKSATAAHADAVSQNQERGKVLDVSLIELLQREYDGNEQGLRQYTRNIMSMARNYLQLDDAQKKWSGEGIPSYFDENQGVCPTHITIIAPEAPEAADFRDRFCSALSGAVQQERTKCDVARNQARPQEITIISVTSVFPVRFVAVVNFLRGEYDKRLAQGEYKRAFLELHSEGESYTLAHGQSLYDLYPETYKPEDVLPWVMLAETMGLLAQGKDNDTGRDRIRLIINRGGLKEPPIELGADRESIIREADPSVIEKLRYWVELVLGGEYLRIDKRKELDTTLLERVKATGEAMTIDSPCYKQEFAAYSVMRKILELGN